jgi:hypothetical protein
MFDTSELVPSKYSPDDGPNWDFLLQEALITQPGMSLFMPTKELAKSYYSEGPLSHYEDERMLIDTSILLAEMDTSKNNSCMVPIPKINELRRKTQFSIQVSFI